MNADALSTRSRVGYGVAGLSVIALVVLLLAVGVFPSHSGSTYYTATFSRAGEGLDQRSDVKVRGITVGGVDSVELNSAGRAKVRFRVDGGVRIPVTTVAGIEPSSVFGPKDITLDLGAGETTGPYLPDNAVIQQTKDPQELSDTAWPLYKLTGAINPEELAGILHTFSQGLQGEGPALHRTVANASTLVDLAYGHKDAIKQALTDISQLSATFGGRGDELVRLTNDLNTVAPAISDNPQKVTQLLDGLDHFATGLNSDLNTYGDRLGPLVDATGHTVNVFYLQRNNILPLLLGLNGFFGSLNSIIRVQGPQGSMLAQVYDYLPLDLCQTLVDVCGPYAGKAGK